MFSLMLLSGCTVYRNYYTNYTLITDEAKTKYLYTEQIDLTNVYLLGEDDSKVYVTSDMISGFNSRVIGEQTLEITYNEMIFYFEIVVAYNYK